jgi:hypothetical protein
VHVSASITGNARNARRVTHAHGVLPVAAARARRSALGPARRLAGRRGEPGPEDLAAAGVSVAGTGAGRCSASSPAAGTAVPCGLPPRHPPAGLPASGRRDGFRPARGRPPPGPYERAARRASGAYDRFATVCVTHAGLLARDGCFGSGLTAVIGVLSTAQAERPGAGPSILAIRVDVTGTGRTVTTGAGLTVPVTTHLSDLPAVDVVVAPALETMTAEDALSAPAARATRAVISAVGTSPAGTTTSAKAVWCPS